MVKIDKDYVFQGPDGNASLLDLFDGRSQLIVGHFMFDPSWENGCSSCSAGADEFSDGHLKHLHARDTSFVYISRAPVTKIEAYKTRKGWSFPWYSSYGSDFNYDFHVTLDESVSPIEYNYRTKAEYEQLGTPLHVEVGQSIELPGRSCFLRDGDMSFTHILYTPVVSNKLAEHTTSSMRLRSADKRTGRNQKVVRAPHAVRNQTSRNEPYYSTLSNIKCRPVGKASKQVIYTGSRKSRVGGFFC